MTGDELAAVLKERQGYVVISVRRRYRVGDIVRPNISIPAEEQTEAPVVIIAESNRAEYRAQSALVAEILGHPVMMNVPDPYFYRVEAAD